MENLKKYWPEWEVVEELGEGSFGKVYKIHREDLGGAYDAALKIIQIPKNKKEIEDVYAEGMDAHSVTTYYHSVLSEIAKEIALMEQLKGNTNIVGYEDHKVVQNPDGVGGKIYIRMELLQPLKSYMKSQKFYESDVIKLGIDLCKALELCQKNRVIHRDIKPENIFISQYGDYKLGDFGVARITEHTTSSMSMKGTYTYMAPEVYAGKRYSYSADIYSLGLVLFKLLNDNRDPFLPPAPCAITFDDRQNSQNRRFSGEPLPRPAHGGLKTADVIGKACAFDPHARYQTAYEMRIELEEIFRQGGFDNTSGIAYANSANADLTYSVFSNNAYQDDSDKTVSFVQSRVPEKQSSEFDDRTEILARTERTDRTERIREADSQQQKKRRNSILPVVIIGVVLLLILIAVLLFWILRGGNRSDVSETVSNPVVGSSEDTSWKEEAKVDKSEGTLESEKEESSTAQYQISLANGIRLYDLQGNLVEAEQLKGYASIDEVVASGEFVTYSVDEKDRIPVDGKVADESGLDQRDADGYHWAKFHFVGPEGDKVSILFRCDLPDYNDIEYPRKYGILSGIMYNQYGEEVIAPAEDTYPNLRLQIGVMTPTDGSCDMSKAFLTTGNKFYYKRTVLPANANCFVKVVIE